jgi:hypothetical protein
MRVCSGPRWARAGLIPIYLLGIIPAPTSSPVSLGSSCYTRASGISISDMVVVVSFVGPRHGGIYDKVLVVQTFSRIIYLYCNLAGTIDGLFSTLASSITVLLILATLADKDGSTPLHFAASRWFRSTRWSTNMVSHSGVQKIQGKQKNSRQVKRGPV